MTPLRTRPYRLFEVTGLELEYAIVDPALQPQCLVEQVFRQMHGRATSDVAYRQVGFSNELAAHVLEIKNLIPQTDLARAELQLMEGVRYCAQVLREHAGARLLPTGMHPFMRPTETALWPRAGRQIYRTYARVFPLYSHGWLNVQSCHVNLPFGTEAETVTLHNAVACLLPYLPALSASSPIYEGTLGSHVDNRLAFYQTNQARIPVITGAVIPEYMTSYRQYRRDILGAIYRALANVSGAARLRHEWVNSRGAILRFNRRAIEIRVLDVQECIKMDVAIAVFVRGVLKRLVKDLQQGSVILPAPTTLVQDFNTVITHGSQARVHAPHVRRSSSRNGRLRTAPHVLRQLLETAEQETPDSERPYLGLVERRLRNGNLSEQITHLVQKRGRTRPARKDAIRALYEELIGCLYTNTPWDG